MTKPITLGVVLRAIRERLGMTYVDMAEHCKVAPKQLAAMERDRKKVMERHYHAYLRLPLTSDEHANLKQLHHVWHDDPSKITCKSCASHDGEMRPGGRLGRRVGGNWYLGDRDELCVNAGECLMVFAWRYGCTATAHCPKACTKREHVERERLVSIGNTLQR